MSNKKILLIDGNSLIFRAYFASAYSGNIMKTKEGIPTNGVFSFANMITSLLNNNDYYDVKVAFDKGKKTFRHKLLENYKAGRNQTPPELIQQFPIAREFLDAANIDWFEMDLIEADDLIGSIAKYVENKYNDFEVEILSSDRDMLQLISDKTVVRIPVSGTSDTEIIDLEKLMSMEKWQCLPKQVCDMKGLIGDSSDNLPGVNGVGPKTAISLIHDYQSLENIYDHLDELKPVLRQKLETDRDIAFLCKEVAQIKTDVEIEGLEVKQLNIDIDKLVSFLQKYEMFSLVKRMHSRVSNINKEEKFEFKIIDKWSKDYECEENAIYIESIDDNYHRGKISGIAIANEKGNFYFDVKNEQKQLSLFEEMHEEASLDQFNDFFLNPKIKKYTFDIKKTWTLLNKNKINFNKESFIFDLMIAGYALNSNIKSDLQIYINNFNPYLKVISDEAVYGKGVKKTDKIDIQLKAEHICHKAFAILTSKPEVVKELKKNDQWDLYEKIDFEFAKVLFDIEQKGVKVDRLELANQTKKTLDKINALDDEMRDMLGDLIPMEFNFSSPKQVKELLFDKMGLPDLDKGSTSKETLDKLFNHHPIINLLIKNRKLTKLYSTYLRGFEKYIFTDGKLHPIFNQTLTNTGRLSCIEPNLQNISIRDEEQKEVRKIFVTEEKHTFLSFDYSQIELRVLAQIGNESTLLNIFANNRDIHSESARLIYRLGKDELVTPEQRRAAKVFNFGIIYGLSDFGLSNDLQISIPEAKEFIKAYYNAFPEILGFKKKIIDFASKNGYVLTAANRKRNIEELNSSNHMIKNFGERAAVNAPIQGTAADVLKVAMINIFKELKAQNLKSFMCAQIHDEIIINVLETEKTQVSNIVETKMKDAFKDMFELVNKNDDLNVPLEVNISEGKNWFEMK